MCLLRCRIIFVDVVSTLLWNENLQYFLSWRGGNGSAWLKLGLLQDCLLSVCFLIFKTFQFIDSKSMIDHVRGACHISCPHLNGWMERIMFFWGNMKQCSIHHIFRSQNVQAHCLSKKGLTLESGSWSMLVSDGERSCYIQDFSIPGL